jgi:pimeloyl-ACP methyl ester carboxylesterase
MMIRVPSEPVKRSTHHVLTADGIRIAFDLYYRSKRDEVLIICPGFFQSKETATFQRLANVLAGSCDVVCMDFRGHGRSDGLFSFSAYEQADLSAVLDWVRERYPRIGLLGFSLGAATAINVASHRNGIRSLVTVSAPSAFEEIEFRFWTPEAIKTGIRGLEPGAGSRPGNPWARKERPIENIRSVAPVPILLIHGTNDQIILHRHSERLHQAAGEPKRLILIEGGGHAEELFRQQPGQFLPPVQEWLRGTLRARATSAPLAPY